MRFLSFSLIITALSITACADKPTAADTTSTPGTTTTAPQAPATPVKHTPYPIQDSSQLIDLGEGLKLYFVEKGTGAKPKPAGNVFIHYHGYLPNGLVFDSSFDRNQPADFGLANLIQGWQRGLAQVPTGSKVVLIVPPALGYGPAGQGNIPPNSTLIFDIDLINTYGG